jgi:hypothetical protein
VSVGCDPLPLPLALLPPLQEARPPMMRALATSESTTFENDWKRGVAKDMAASGVLGLAIGQRLCQLPRSIARYTSRTGPMLTLEGFSGGEFRLARLPKSGIAHPPFWAVPNGTRYLVQQI